MTQAVHDSKAEVATATKVAKNVKPAKSTVENQAKVPKKVGRKPIYDLGAMGNYTVRIPEQFRNYLESEFGSVSRGIIELVAAQVDIEGLDLSKYNERPQKASRV